MSRARARRAVPTPLPVPAPSKGFPLGATVRVVNGASKGRRGVVVGRWRDYAPGVQSWIVDVDDCAGRVIREDFLEVVS